MFPALQFVSVPNDDAIFNCISLAPGFGSVQWMVNETSIETLTLTGVTTEFSKNIGLGSLAFTNLPLEYNSTRIKCIGTFESGVTRESESTMLLLQGTKNYNLVFML